MNLIVRAKCSHDGCPWLIFTGLDIKTTNFMVHNYHPFHKCVTTNYNYLCNSKYQAKHYKDRINNQT